MEERGAARFRPVIPVTVAIERDRERQHFGVIADISESGACVWTDAVFGVGEALVVGLASPRADASLHVVGKVVWSKPETQEQDTIRYGLQWHALEERQQAQLRDLIARSH